MIDIGKFNKQIISHLNDLGSKVTQIEIIFVFPLMYLILGQMNI